MKATAEWFPAKERGLAGGIYNIGASVGSMLAPPLVVWAILAYNWQTAFVITGALGLVWVVLWLFFYQLAGEASARFPTEERELHRLRPGEVPAGGHRAPSIWKLLEQRNFWGIALPRFLADPTWGTLTFWLPLYLRQRAAFRPEAHRDVRLDAVPGAPISAACSAASVAWRCRNART